MTSRYKIKNSPLELSNNSILGVGDFQSGVNCIPGDVNHDGMVSAEDAIAIQEHLANIGSPFTDSQGNVRKACLIEQGDNSVDIKDAVLIQQLLHPQVSTGRDTNFDLKSRMMKKDSPFVLDNMSLSSDLSNPDKFEYIFNPSLNAQGSVKFNREEIKSIHFSERNNWPTCDSNSEGEIRYNGGEHMARDGQSWKSMY